MEFTRKPGIYFPYKLGKYLLGLKRFNFVKYNISGINEHLHYFLNLTYQ